MTAQVTHLIGKWEFIDSELYQNSEWEQVKDFHKSMVWTFIPQYLGSDRAYGKIIETTPVEAPIELDYLHYIDENLLKVEILVDSMSGETDADLYKISTSDQSSHNHSTIKLSILSQEGCPPPYRRYTLQAIE